MYQLTPTRTVRAARISATGGSTLLLLLAGIGCSHGQGLLISSSESVSFQFPSLPNTFTVLVNTFSTGLLTPACAPYNPLCGPGRPVIGDNPISTATLADQGLVSVAFGNSLLDPGEALTLDLYENSLSDVPFASQTFSGIGASSLATATPAAWQDLQGVVRVTMNEGSVELDHLSFMVIQNGVGYGGTIIVPEPSTIA